MDACRNKFDRKASDGSLEDIAGKYTGKYSPCVAIWCEMVSFCLRYPIQHHLLSDELTKNLLY